MPKFIQDFFPVWCGSNASKVRKSKDTFCTTLWAYVLSSGFSIWHREFPFYDNEHVPPFPFKETNLFSPQKAALNPFARLFTPPKINMSPKKRTISVGKYIFQSLIFKGTCQFLVPPPKTNMTMEHPPFKICISYWKMGLSICHASF